MKSNTNEDDFDEEEEYQRHDDDEWYRCWWRGTAMIMNLWWRGSERNGKLGEMNGRGVKTRFTDESMPMKDRWCHVGVRLTFYDFQSLYNYASRATMLIFKLIKVTSYCHIQQSISWKNLFIFAIFFLVRWRANDNSKAVRNHCSLQKVKEDLNCCHLQALCLIVSQTNWENK